MAASMGAANAAVLKDPKVRIHRFRGLRSSGSIRSVDISTVRSSASTVVSAVSTVRFQSHSSSSSSYCFDLCSSVISWFFGFSCRMPSQFWSFSSQYFPFQFQEYKFSAFRCYANFPPFGCTFLSKSRNSEFLMWKGKCLFIYFLWYSLSLLFRDQGHATWVGHGHGFELVDLIGPGTRLGPGQNWRNLFFFSFFFFFVNKDWRNLNPIIKLFRPSLLLNS